MPSLDGYSLNEKMDRLHDDVSAQIEQLQKDFHNLYSYIKNIEEKANEKPKAKKITKTKEKVSTEEA